MKENNAKRPNWIHPNVDIVMDITPTEFGPPSVEQPQACLEG